MQITDARHIHFIGIGGVGVSALAKFFLARGVKVTGSDVSGGGESDVLAERGIEIGIGHPPLPEGVDTVVYSSAVPHDDPERADAEARGVPSHSYTEMLGLLMQGVFGVAVSGTNGKTTTTALLGKILENAGNDPTVIVGGRVPGWDRNLRLGKSNLFVVEGCEYMRNILNLHPRMIILTNIAADHLDCYQDIDDIIATFTEYVAKLPEDGILVYNADDENTRRVAGSVSCRKVSYGAGINADVRYEKKDSINGAQEFSITLPDGATFSAYTHLPGVFNLENIAAASAGAHLLGAGLGTGTSPIRHAVEAFEGTWRRFEKVGKLGEALVVSDYAHHPDAVRRTIAGAKELYGNGKVLAVFQPHQRDRTIKLFDEFAASFDDADEVILEEIYEVKGRNTADHDVSSRDLAEAVQKNNPGLKVSFAKNARETEKLIRERAKDFSLILIMGAGDIDDVARRLVS